MSHLARGPRREIDSRASASGRRRVGSRTIRNGKEAAA
jgi:hypothetical protein